MYTEGKWDVNNVVKEQEKYVILKSTGKCSNFVNHVLIPEGKKNQSDHNGNRIFWEVNEKLSKYPIQT